jgi:hypothetical protein
VKPFSDGLAPLAYLISSLCEDGSNRQKFGVHRKNVDPGMIANRLSPAFDILPKAR